MSAARIAGLAGLAALVACTGPAAPPPSPGTTAVSVPAGLPSGMPTAVVTTAPAGTLPPTALVPEGASVTGTWTARTTAGERVVVAWATPGGDPFRAAGGVAAWARTEDGSAWIPTYVDAYAADAGVLGVRAEIADVTGDGSDDAVVSEGTGGSGGCARWRVIDLAAGSLVWRRDLCDAAVTAHAAPAGLRLSRAVFLPGDAHCCPSRTNTTVLTYRAGGRWTVVSRRTT